MYISSYKNNFCRRKKGCDYLKNSCAVFSHSCLTLCDPLDCSPWGSSVCGIIQARIVEPVAFPASGDLPNPENRPMSSASPALAGRLFTTTSSGKLKEHVGSFSYLFPYYGLLRCSSTMLNTNVDNGCIFCLSLNIKKLFLMFNFIIKYDVCWRYWVGTLLRLKKFWYLNYFVDMKI